MAPRYVCLHWWTESETEDHENFLALPINFGRAKGNDVVLDQTHVSRHHARLSTNRNGQILVEDLGSANGTYVNQQKLSQAQAVLGDDDEIRIGSMIFRVTRPAPTQHKLVRCINCENAVPEQNCDCPWCGYSLAHAQSLTVRS